MPNVHLTSGINILWGRKIINIYFIKTIMCSQVTEKFSKNPHISSARPGGLKDCCRIKLRAPGFRLAYQVTDNMLIIAVVAAGKRERGSVCDPASGRMR
ncbi:TPA: type II toxin-antitoxin system RelE/ParE family toxin [Salmonella enterica]|uniref:type II toxin-antitoxin system RelE family toxin n=1 Tax=Salmonella enterica TaxID=28901 RepID=UPI00093F3270|nr:type II toxin-antitoxin system RelE/ParE family toxin [Salmonella enterica]HAU3020607.1 type II toxin-antitoxin system RelE/ParE family toxin [Salmonella enterica]